MQDTLTWTNNNQYDYLNIILFHYIFLDITVIKVDYLDDIFKPIFKALIQDHKVNKEFIVSNLIKYDGVNLDLLTQIIAEEIFYVNLEQKFKELEKAIIGDYKLKQAKHVLEKGKTFDDIYNSISKLSEINTNENDYIKANDIKDCLITKNKKIDLGFYQLDFSLNLSEQDLLIVAGGTGTGKTAFALNLLSNLSKNYQCIYFNMEMSKNILYRRLLGIETRVPLKDLNNISTLADDVKRTLWNTMKNIEERHIMLVNKSLNINEIKSIISSVKGDKHKIVFLDHIGLIKSSGNSLYEKMTNVAKELRGISINYDCTLIGLCQLSRESQKDSKTPPKLQDLRDSGEIEQSARKVLMLYSPNFDSKDEVIPMKIIIAKNDDGNKVIKDFEFTRNIQKFSEKYN